MSAWLIAAAVGVALFALAFCFCLAIVIVGARSERYRDFPAEPASPDFDWPRGA
jgi:hypothetical protein